MKRLAILAVSSALLSALLGGCVVVPAAPYDRHYYHDGYYHDEYGRGEHRYDNDWSYRYRDHG